MSLVAVRHPVVIRLALTLACALFLAPPTASADPIAPYPANPGYFFFRGRPAFLITSGEHYGAVLNREFDYGPYLAELAARRFNQTRLFSGSYREVPGSFQISANTLAPAAGKFLAPWARTKEPGAVDGGNKFDLTTWDSEYLDRLRKFIRAAGSRGIVVELVLFCPFYEDNLWQISPMNTRNNINGLGSMPRTEVFTLKHPAMVAVHESLVRKLVTELHQFDNLYYEICNEPYFGGVTLDWQRRIAGVIVESETKLGRTAHMIAQNIANGRARIEAPDPAVSLFNFHYATPPDVVALNARLKTALGDDETGFRGSNDRVYRTEAWEFLLAGGSVFSNLDYSFTTQHPNGTAVVKPPTPGGGGPSLRKQLTILRDFLCGFEFARMRPDRSVIKGGVPEKVTAYALVETGRAYAVYLSAGGQVDLVMELPPGRYRIDWVDPRSGPLDQGHEIDHRGGRVKLSSPKYEEDVAMRIIASS